MVEEVQAVLEKRELNLNPVRELNLNPLRWCGMQDEDEVPADSVLRAKPSSKRARTAVEPPDMGDFHDTVQRMGVVAIGGLADMVESLRQVHLQ